MSPLPGMVAHEICDRLLNLAPSGTADRIISIVTQMNGQPGPAAPMDEGSAGPPPLPAEDYAGDYEHPVYGSIVISADDAGLHGELHGYTFRLGYRQGEEFVLEDDPADAGQFPPMVGAAPLEFSVDAQGSVTGLRCGLDPAVEPVEFTRAGSD